MMTAYQMVRIVYFPLFIFMIASISLATNATSKQNSSLYVFHSEQEILDVAFIQPLSIELNKQIAEHQIKIINTRKQTQANLNALLKEANSCAVTVGKQALQAILATRNSAPIFSTLVSKTNLDNLVGNYTRLGSLVTGIYQEQSFKRQLLLSKAINKKSKNLVVFLGRNTRYRLPEIQAISDSESMNLVYNILKQQESPQQYLSELSLDNTTLIVINDQQHYSQQDMQALLVASHNKQIPIIGGKISDGETAAMVSIYTPYKQLVNEVASELKIICSNSLRFDIASQPALAKPRFSNNYRVTINQQIAEHLNYLDLNELHLTKMVKQLESQPQGISKQ